MYLEYRSRIGTADEITESHQQGPFMILLRGLHDISRCMRVNVQSTYRKDF